jgi:uncharacterized protein
MPTENVRFSQSYVDDKIGPDGRPLCSATVALLVDDLSVFSDMHRLPTDEIWHFYLGDPIELLLLHPDGSDELVILGHDVLAGQRVQTVVAAGVYMGARLRPGGEFAVYGNTMAPGFALSDFEAASAPLPTEPATLSPRTRSRHRLGSPWKRDGNDGVQPRAGGVTREESVLGGDFDD